MKNVVYLCIVLWIVLGVQSDAFAGANKSKQSRKSASAQLNATRHVRLGSNLRVWLSNESILGVESWNEFVPADNCKSPGLGCMYPDSACIEHLYGAGPIVASTIEGVRHVTEGYNGNIGYGYFLPDVQDTFRSHFWYAAVDSYAIGSRRGFDDDSDGKNDEDELDGSDNDGDWNPITDDLGADGLPDSLETGCRGDFDPVDNPDPAYDNYDTTLTDLCRPVFDGTFPVKNNKFLYTQNNGLSDHGEPHVDEDYGVFSQNDYYCTYTDTTTIPGEYPHYPQGIKIFQKSYTWEKGSEADQFVMLEYIIVNVGQKTMNDVYIGMFADMDIGNGSSSGYAQNNYARYDRTTRTAYIQNPMDDETTPLGLTLLSLSKPMDSLKHIFQWFGFENPCGGTSDSALYTCVSGSAFPSSLIKPNQSPNSLHDTRVLLSSGPFGPMQPGDTVKMMYALVGGLDEDHLLFNAERAREMLRRGNLIQPGVQIVDSGIGKPVMLSWSTGFSPFGEITSYKVYYGSTSHQYSDSIVTSSKAMRFDSLVRGVPYYFSVVAIDEYGNQSGFSKEVSTIPLRPDYIGITNGEVSIFVERYNTYEPDIVGFNLFRRSSTEQTFTKLNTNLISGLIFEDTTARSNITYYYTITVVDQEGFESDSSLQASGKLKPPAMPSGVAVGPGVNFIRLAWLPNIEGDFAGYQIYRRRSNDTTSILLTPQLYSQTLYTDTSVATGVTYYYNIVAVDTLGGRSENQSAYTGYTAPLRHNILIIDASPYNVDTLKREYQRLFRGFPDTVLKFSSVWFLYYGLGALSLSEYSTIIWLQPDQIPGDYSYPLALKGHLLGGRNLVIMGRRLPILNFTLWYAFLNEHFGIDFFTQSDSSSTFVAAAGFDGFPHLNVDVDRVGRLNYIDRFTTIPSERVLYRYVSDPFDSQSDGDPVGIRAIDTSMHGYYFSFPLTALDSLSARAFIEKILSEVGEPPPLAVKEEETLAPESFALSQNYPNPFNPSTNIKFSVAESRFITLKVFDLLGREVATLVEERLQPGVYTSRWDASHASAGIYYCRMVASSEDTKDTFTKTHKLLLIK